MAEVPLGDTLRSLPQSWPHFDRFTTPKNLGGAALAAGLVVVLVVAFAAGGSEDPRAAGGSAASPSETVPAEPTPAPPLDPSWPERLTMLSGCKRSGSARSTHCARPCPDWRVQGAWRARPHARRGRRETPPWRAARPCDRRGPRLQLPVEARSGRLRLLLSAKFDREAERLLRVIRAKGSRRDRVDHPAEGD